MHGRSEYVRLSCDEAPREAGLVRRTVSDWTQGLEYSGALGRSF
jgi:hypothetical protein